VDQGATYLAGVARPGDRVLTIGAGDVDRAATLLLETLA
jgi:UDP-N-acetylmuramate-alanine ligase